MPTKAPVLSKKQKKKQIASLMEKAGSICTLPTNLQNWSTYKSHDLHLTIQYSTSTNLTTDDQSVIFSLLKANMEDMYEKSDWGWKDDEKRAEMFSPEARYLIARDSTGVIVAFSHFRFVVESNLPVLYCYELQIVESHQRKGLGRHMMYLLMAIAHHFKAVKVMLTVFGFNEVAMKFYREALQFRDDESCPYEEEEKSYKIMCRFVDKEEMDRILSVYKL